MSLYLGVQHLQHLQQISCYTFQIDCSSNYGSNYCENNRIETLHNESSLPLDVIKLEETRVVINWGGYGSSFEIGSNLFNYFKLDYPGGPPPRGKTFTHVKMVMNGTLKNNNTEEVIQKVEKLGGLVVQDTV